MERSPSFQHWHQRYPPEGSWIYVPGNTSGRFVWRGVIPVLSNAYGDQPLHYGTLTHRPQRYIQSWRYPRSNSRAWFYVGSSSAVELQRFVDRLAFTVHTAVPTDHDPELYEWAPAQVYETQLPVGYYEFEPEPFRRGFYRGAATATTVGRALLGLVEHHPDALETVLTFTDWEAALDLLGQGIRAERSSLLTAFADQATADLSAYPDLAELPIDGVATLLAERYHKLGALRVAQVLSAAGWPGSDAHLQVVQRAAEEERLEQERYEAESAERSQKFEQEQAEWTQKFKQKQAEQFEAYFQPQGEDAYGPFATYHFVKFDRDVLEQFFRETQQRWWSAERAEKFALAALHAAGRERYGTPGTLLPIGPVRQDARRALYVFCPLEPSAQVQAAVRQEVRERRARARVATAALRDKAREEREQQWRERAQFLLTPEGQAVLAEQAAREVEYAAMQADREAQETAARTDYTARLEHTSGGVRLPLIEYKDDRRIITVDSEDAPHIVDLALTTTYGRRETAKLPYNKVVKYFVKQLGVHEKGVGLRFLNKDRYDFRRANLEQKRKKSRPQ